MFAFKASKSKTSVIDFDEGIAAENIFSVVIVFKLNGLLPSVKILDDKLLTLEDEAGTALVGHKILNLKN